MDCDVGITQLQNIGKRKAEVMEAFGSGAPFDRKVKLRKTGTR